MLHNRHTIGAFVAILGCLVLVSCFGDQTSSHDFWFGKKLRAKQMNVNPNAIDENTSPKVSAIDTETPASLEEEKFELFSEDHLNPAFASQLDHSLQACLGFLKTFQSEAHFYQIQARAKKFHVQNLSTNYLSSHLRYHGLVHGEGASVRRTAQICTKVLFAVDRYQDVDWLRSAPSSHALAYIKTRHQLYTVKYTRFPLRSCALFLSKLDGPQSFVKYREQLARSANAPADAQLKMYRLLRKQRMGGDNLSGKLVSAQSCIHALASFHSFQDLVSFTKLTPTRQLVRLNPFTLPAMAH